MSSPKYKLSKSFIYKNHHGHPAHAEAGEIYHWNQHRFVNPITGQEVSRAKVRDAGARMIPCDSLGKELDLSPAGPDIVMPEPIVAERKVAFSL